MYIFFMKPHYHISKKEETPSAHIMLCEDQIVRVLFKGGIEISEHDIELNFEAYKRLLLSEKLHPFMIWPEDSHVTYSEKARVYAKEHENDFPKLCIAIIVRTLAHKLIANFYLKFHQPQTLVKVFNDLHEAEEWCLKQYDDYQKSANPMLQSA